MLKALTISDSEEFLRQKSKVVYFNDVDLKQNIKDIKEYCLLNDSLYALACVQLGIPKRIVYIKSTTPNDSVGDPIDKQTLMINPKIISQKGKTEFWEACVSGGTNFGLVERPYEIVVKYQNEKGEYLTQIFEGFSATVVSHELDHLEGIFHMDRAKKLIQLEKSERVSYREKYPYKIISKDCEFSYEKLNKII